MQLNKLSIINYKNIEAATLNLSAKLNCFIGHNGEGKTNLLDAVYYLSFCRSAFNPKDSEVMRHEADYFVLEGDYTTDNEDKEQVYCGMKRGSKKHFKRNKKEYKRLSMHIGLVPLIFVSPADATLIDGGSEERRRLMDVVISQYDTPYIEDLNRYNKALQQRNKLLKQEEEPDATLMELLEIQMAEYGEAIYKKRAAFVEELTPVFQRIYQTICENREKVSLEYVSHCQRGSLLDVIQRDRAKDRIMGYSLHGVHKDDLVMKLGDYPIRREGSQGQNKTYVLALKLAQFDFLRRTSGNNTPLLLLDDIFDKLDSSRVEQIVRLVSGDDFGQIFITDTNRDHLDKILHGSSFSYKLFSVEGGEIKEKKE
ncbi:DNA replication and repair protein RecF [uncultured Prevotella sp.]|jgi:DNA replication and repair protein recF|uniref:DNA replication/repair protein RecF n=1 Tax=uncultured Prevotella sp. TaxID=159272 RepID=UPI002352B0A7|nr:DNA replication and repair protein RecF [uncultured Prevotella sp.]